MTSSVTASQLQNLRAHVKDWKGHSLDALGPLYLHEILTIRRGSQIKEYGVHVFENALIFIAEETESNSKTLHLKGRLYMKSITEVMKLVSPEEMQIEISMDGMEGDLAVALIFQEENKLDLWRDLIVLLAAKAKAASTASDEPEAAVLCQQPVEGHTESKPTESVGEKHNIAQTNHVDVESQIAEEKIQQDDVRVGRDRRWGMVIMLLSCLALQGLMVTYFFAQNTEFIEENE